MAPILRWSYTPPRAECGSDPFLAVEDQCEAGRLAGAAVEGVVEAVLLEDLGDDRQPDAVPRGTGREEGCEELPGDLRREARAGVLDLEPPAAVPAVGADRDAPLPADRVERVAHDVDENLLHLRTVHRGDAQRHLQLPEPVDAVALALRAEQPRDVLQ